MKGLILSGGKGTRLRPLTYTSAKQLVPVANKPVLFYAIEAIVAADIREIGIIVGDTAAEIRQAVGDGSAFGARVTYIEQEAPLGLAHAVKIAEEFIAGEPFVMYLGDNLIAGGIRELVTEFRELSADGCNAEILLASVPNPQQFGVAELDPEGRVHRLVEKPAEPKSDLALVGVYMFDATVFESVHAIEPSARGELEITDAIQDMIDRGRHVHPHKVRGWWKDTGKLEDMLEANRIVLESLHVPRGREDHPGISADSRVEGRVELAPGVTVTGSVIRGPVVVGEGAVIEDAFIGPYTSIGCGCRIAHCEIENSIVLEGSEIANVPLRIDGSLVGRNVKIRHSEIKPKAYRFMLGDRSELEIP
jgi:glucose-1-phosphate thymidylyltransferase